MNGKWVGVYETDKQYQAILIRDQLILYNIDAIILNKQDQSYIVLGTIEVLVREKDKERAIRIIRQEG